VGDTSGPEQVQEGVQEGSYKQLLKGHRFVSWKGVCEEDNRRVLRGIEDQKEHKAHVEVDKAKRYSEVLVVANDS
jgi:hypothetical protein